MEFSSNAFNCIYKDILEVFTKKRKFKSLITVCFNERFIVSFNKKYNNVVPSLDFSVKLTEFILRTKLIKNNDNYEKENIRLHLHMSLFVVFRIHEWSIFTSRICTPTLRWFYITSIK